MSGRTSAQIGWDTRRRNEQAKKAKGHGHRPMDNFLAGPMSQPSFTGTSFAGGATGNGAPTPSSAVVPNDSDEDHVVVPSKRTRKPVSYAPVNDDSDEFGDFPAEMAKLADAESADDDFGPAPVGMEVLAEMKVPAVTEKRQRKRRPVSNVAVIEDSDEGEVIDEMASPAEMPVSVVKGKRKRKPADEMASLAEMPVSKKSKKTSKHVDVDEDAEIVEVERDPNQLARLRSKVSEPDDGSEVPLDLTSVLEHMFEYLIFWAVHKSNLSNEVLEGLVDFGAERLAEHVTKHLLPVLREYLDKCIRRGNPFSYQDVMRMLDERSIEDSIGYHGLYMIILTKFLPKGETAFPYCGSGSAFSHSDVQVGSHKRMKDHLSPACREKNRTKYLYRVWDSPSNPVVQEDVHIAGIMHTDVALTVKYGRAVLLACETVVTTLLCGFHPEASKNFLKGYEPDAALPSSLIRIFKQTVEKSGCQTIFSSSKNSQILRETMAFVSGVRIVAANVDHPCNDNTIGHRAPLHRTLDGTEVNIIYGTYHANRAGASLCNSFHMMLDLDHLWPLGFPEQCSRAILKLTLSDEHDPENWARLEGDGVTANNSLGYEKAPRIRFTLSWVGEDESLQSATVRCLLGKASAIERSSLVMTLLEYADGTLPNGLKFEGYRRRDLFRQKGIQGAKVWDIDSPESQGTLNAKQIERQKGAAERALRGDRLQCPNTNCIVKRGGCTGKRYWTVSVVDLVKHLVNHLTGQPKECGQIAGLTCDDDVDDAFLQQCVIPGVDFEPKRPKPHQVQEGPPVCECLGCGKGFSGKFALDNLISHLFKVVDIKKSCRDAFRLQADSMASRMRIEPYARVKDRVPIPDEPFK
jgi:hypothetical protein